MVPFPADPRLSVFVRPSVRAGGRVPLRSLGRRLGVPPGCVCSDHRGRLCVPQGFAYGTGGLRVQGPTSTTRASPPEQPGDPGRELRLGLHQPRALRALPFLRIIVLYCEFVSLFYGWDTISQGILTLPAYSGEVDTFSLGCASWGSGKAGGSTSLNSSSIAVAWQARASSASVI